MNKTTLILTCALIAGGCSNKENSLPSQPNMNTVRANLAFTCVHEADHLPPVSPEADQLFKYGRYLETKAGPKDFDEVARYYRIAAANGHYKANNNLQQLVSRGSATSPDAPKETIDLVEQLIKQGVPGGYYDMGHYLELGYGVKQDPEKALRYFRKAADLGSPEGQFYVAEKLSPVDAAPEIAKQMYQCAVDQGSGEAAENFGVFLQTAKLYTEAVKAFQKGVAAGNTLTASSLEEAFKGPPPSDRLNYLELPNDPERSRRYRVIGEFIDANESRNPKVPDIDKIVPLPPAKLPPWDGTFQWQKERDAAVPPQKPSDELINQMAKKTSLDPATGLPLAGTSSKTSAEDQPATVATRLPIGTVASTGDPCPEDGVWCAKLGKGQMGDAQRRFLKGDVLPSLIVHEPRKVALLDQVMGLRQHMAKVEWELIGYIDQA
ncbi:hypothetical protein SAMN05216466_106400 [Paraburkholderia phenazinium]|uniref:DUF6396 domain-containing protein n=1 Tax=Paraburkholderia phenazinium TaxID=60549 RepID=A0A1G7Z0Z5_9BURK|nr:sel1 repeat family protein [Paraburkholderia phenazinium]SDH02383.1 hypothetical protein SAMN05216466_106400 [Paraburkholderia phenazinium]